MTNIKISELNELETRHEEDLLAIVDTNNNETKKIKVETLAPENFELYAIADTQPTIPVGESYYNTKNNKIFTNIGGIYVDKGEPKTGILYIIFSDKATFAYNGTTLVSVGGGSGSSDIVVVPTEIPTEETKLEIEDEDFDFRGSEITDEYSESTEVGYSANYSNGHFQGKFEKGRVYVSTMTPSTVGSSQILTKKITFEGTYTNAPIVLGNVGAERPTSYYGNINFYTRDNSNTGCYLCIDAQIQSDNKVWVDYIVISMD